MLLNGTHLQINTLISIILLMIFLERWLNLLLLRNCLPFQKIYLAVVNILQVKCKVALQKELDLPVRPDCPMVTCLMPIYTMAWYQDLLSHVVDVTFHFCRLASLGD